MARVDVEVYGRTYPVMCEDGQEQRVLQLAQQVNDQVRSISQAVGGSIPDAHLLVLTSLTFANDLDEVRAQGDLANAEEAAQLANVLDKLAARVESLAARIEKS